MENIDLPLGVGLIKGGWLDVPREYIEALNTEYDAICMTWDLRLRQRRKRVDQKDCAEDLGIDPALFSRILSGKANIPREKRIPFMRWCGNRVLHDWETLRLESGDQRQREIQALEQRLKELREAV